MNRPQRDDRAMVSVTPHMADIVKAANGSFEHLSKTLGLADVAEVGRQITSFALTAQRKQKDEARNAAAA